MAVSKEKWEELHSRMQRLDLKEADLKETFILGRGPGGQKINKTASTVYIKHIPTGLEIKCSKDRSQDINRFFARRELCEKIEKQLFGIKSQKEKQIDKIRKQKKRKSRKIKNKILQNSTDN